MQDADTAAADDNADNADTEIHQRINKTQSVPIVTATTMTTASYYTSYLRSSCFLISIFLSLSNLKLDPELECSSISIYSVQFNNIIYFIYHPYPQCTSIIDIKVGDVSGAGCMQILGFANCNCFLVHLSFWLCFSFVLSWRGYHLKNPWWRTH